MGKFEFASAHINFSGTFNIYQAKNGSIMLALGAKATALTYSQVNDLDLSWYELTDFDHDDFMKFYKTQFLLWNPKKTLKIKSS